MPSQHDLLLAALTASITYLVKQLYVWRGKTPPTKETTFTFAAMVGFILYLIDAAFPLLFGETVVNAFSKALAVPGLIGVLFDTVRKANPYVAEVEHEKETKVGIPYEAGQEATDPSLKPYRAGEDAEVPPQAAAMTDAPMTRPGITPPGAGTAYPLRTSEIGMETSDAPPEVR